MRDAGPLVAKEGRTVEDCRNSIARTLLYHARLGLRDAHALKAIVMESFRLHYPRHVV